MLQGPSLGAAISRIEDGCRRRHGVQHHLDTGGESGDLAVEGIDLIQQHPHQFGVMVVEPAPKRFDEGRPFGPHPAAGQVGEPPRITFPGDQGVEHVAHHRVSRVEATHDTLISASSSSFSNRCQ